ncbi:MAG: DNA methylase, partial [Ruminococcus sp.]|nr:DNA methylase [Ruminococcus sp.]
RVIPADKVPEEAPLQLDLFSDFEEQERLRQKEERALSREHELQKAVLSLKKRFGKNAVLKGMNLEEDATARQRNAQVGGHKA